MGGIISTIWALHIPCIWPLHAFSSPISFLRMGDGRNLRYYYCGELSNIGTVTVPVAHGVLCVCLKGFPPRITNVKSWTVRARSSCCGYGSKCSGLQTVYATNWICSETYSLDEYSACCWRRSEEYTLRFSEAEVLSYVEPTVWDARNRIIIILYTLFW